VRAEKLATGGCPKALRVTIGVREKEGEFSEIEKPESNCRWLSRSLIAYLRGEG
jgi:hypothetical protein